MAVQQILLTYHAATGAVDPFFSNVIALLHLDGASGSTSFPDSSPLNLTFVRDGTPTISTTQSKFGGASLALSGTGQNLRSPASAGLAFGLAPWTIEGWIRPSTVSAGAYRGIVTLDTAADTGLFIVGNKLTWYAGGNYQHQGTVSANVWTHVAVVNDAVGDIRLFQGGVLGTTVFPTGGINYTENRYFIGSSSQGVEYFAGHIDEVRITKGVARYTTTFTPPTASFPNS